MTTGQAPYVAVAGYVLDLAEWIHVTIAAELDSRLAFRLPAFFFSEEFCLTITCCFESVSQKIRQ